MSQDKQTTELRPPRCPHCNAEMPELGLFQWMVQPWLILALHCPKCWKSLHYTVVPAEIVAEAPPAKPRLLT